jgi:hypothetical protein
LLSQRIRILAMASTPKAALKAKNRKRQKVQDRAVGHTVRKLPSGMFSFQEEAAIFLSDQCSQVHTDLLLEVDTGLGKNIILRRLVQLQKCCAIAICPGQLVGQMAHALRMSPNGKGWAPRVVACETGKHLQKLVQIDHDIAVVNEALRFWRDPQWAKNYNLIIVDEAHRMGRNSSRLKSCRRFDVPVVWSTATPSPKLVRHATAHYKFTKLPHIAESLGLPHVEVRLSRQPFPDAQAYNDYVQSVTRAILANHAIGPCSHFFALLVFGEFLLKRLALATGASIKNLLQLAARQLGAALDQTQIWNESHRQGIHRLNTIAVAWQQSLQGAGMHCQQDLSPVKDLFAPEIMPPGIADLFNRETAQIVNSENIAYIADAEYNALVCAHQAADCIQNNVQSVALPPPYIGCCVKGFQRTVMRTTRRMQPGQEAFPRDVVPFYLTTDKSAGARRQIIKKFASFGGDMAKFLVLKRGFLGRNIQQDSLMSQVLRIGGESQWFFTTVGAFLFRRHVLVCDQTVDVGLNLHRYVKSICSKSFIPKYDALQQFVSRVNRIAVDQKAQTSITVDMNLVEDSLEELFHAHVEVECEAHRAKLIGPSSRESLRQKRVTSVCDSIEQTPRTRRRWKTSVLHSSAQASKRTLLLGAPQNARNATNKQQRKRPRLAIEGEASLTRGT